MPMRNILRTHMLMAMAAVAITVAVALTACGDTAGHKTTAEADSLINAAYELRDYQRLITLADSLRQKGDLADGEAYYWLGYANDRLMRKHLADFYWLTGLEAVEALNDKASINTYAEIASRLTGLRCTIGDYEAAMKVAVKATEKLAAAGADTTSNFTNLLIYIGCCQSRFGLKSNDTYESLEQAYQRHLQNIANRQTPDAYKDAIVGVVNVCYNFLEIRNYALALRWAERYDDLVTQFEATGLARTDYTERQRARCQAYRATALEGLGRSREAAAAYEGFEQSALGQTPEGKYIASDYLAIAGKWEQAADNFSSLAALQEQYSTAYSLENIQKTYIRKFHVNMMAGRRDTAMAVSMDIAMHLDSAITTSRAEEAREQESIHQKELEISQRDEQMERQRHLSWYIFLGLLIAALIVYNVTRMKVQRRLQKAHNDLQQAYNNLEVANARAEESSRMKSNFIQQISHEIRTPLNILSGFTQVVTTPGMQLEEDEQREINKGIVQNTERITDLVNKMLELSDAQSNIVIDCKDDIPAIQIAVEAADASGIHHASHLDFDMVFDPDVETATINTNRRAAVRALTLMLNNARKFTKLPGTNSAANNAQSPDKKRATLTVKAQSDTMLYIVEDNGIGVPPAEAERIFDEFVQLDDYYDGTGIGLTVARSLAQRMGGNITLDTTYTDGARFIMQLPRNSR